MSRIDVNLNHVKRFYEDSQAMIRASLSINQGERDMMSLIKKIESEKGAVGRVLQGTKKSKGQVSSTIPAVQRKISWLKSEIARKMAELSSLRSSASFAWDAATRAAIYAEIAAVKAEIEALKGKLSRCQAVLEELRSAKQRLETEEQKLESIVTRLNRATEELRGLLKETGEIREDSESTSRRAVELLAQIIVVIQKYLSQTLRSGKSLGSRPLVSTTVSSRYPSRTFYSANGLEPFQPNEKFLASALTSEERAEIFDNQKALEGSILYLQQQGVDFETLDSAKETKEQLQILMKSGVEEKQAKQVLAIYNGEFLSEPDGSHIPFYSTSPQTAGDSYEFHRFFVNLRDGKPTAKEVPFELSSYKGRPCTFLGYNEKIENERRETDVVRIEGNREIHEELKIGRVYGSKGKEKFRQELYGDDLRLRLFPNQEQEYRIRKNSINQKCMLEDKEMVRYLFLMAERHPNRVRVYFNDRLLSLQELEKMSH